MFSLVGEFSSCYITSGDGLHWLQIPIQSRQGSFNSVIRWELASLTRLDLKSYIRLSRSPFEKIWAESEKIPTKLNNDETSSIKIIYGNPKKLASFKNKGKPALLGHC